MRNLLGLGAAVVCGYCGRAPPPPTGTAARLCASKPARALHTGPSGTLHTCRAWCPVDEPQLCRSVQNSPCSASWWRQRYKTLPAYRKSAKSSHFGRAGRVLYRKWGRAARAGRVLYRKWGRAARAGRVLYRKWGRAARAGRVLYRKWAALGSCCWAFPAHGHWGGAFRTRRCAPRRWRWGFCTTRSPQPVCRRRVAPSCSAIPPVEGPA